MNRRIGDTGVDGGLERRAHPAEVSLPLFGIYLFESHHAVGFEMAMGRWPFHKICWSPMGRGMLELEDGAVPLRRDDVLFIPEGMAHRFVDDPDDPLTLVVACFSADVSLPSTALGRVYGRLRERFPPSRPLRAANAFQLQEVRRGFRGLLAEQTHRALGFEAALHGGLMGLIVRFLRGCESGESPGRGDRERALDGVLDFLHSHFDEPIQLPAMARRCDLSVRHFSQLFRQRTGMSLIAYLNTCRIAHAKERLRETRHIAYACYESGFQDMAYFYRVFRKHTGQTPKAFAESSQI